MVSASTSPAPKKSKNNLNEDDDLMWWDDLGVSLVGSLEKMDLDNARGKKRKDIEVSENVSDLMDKKVLEKRSKQDKEHEEYLEMKKVLDLEKAKEKEKEIKLNQSKKDHERRKNLEAKTPKIIKAHILPPHLTEIPDRCKKFFKEDSAVYRVPGNGNCGPGVDLLILLKMKLLDPP